MPFWKKKEPEIPQPHVEPGMSAPQSSEPNPIRFSDEPQFGTVHPSQTAVPPTRVRQPSDGEFATHPSAIQTPVTSAQKESFATVRPTPATAQEMPLHIEENPFASAPAAKESVYISSCPRIVTFACQGIGISYAPSVRAALSFM